MSTPFMNTQSRTERRTLNERRVQEHSPVFPFFDSKQTLVREDRRLIPNRSINNIQIQSSDKSEAANSRLFLWYKDKVCELMQGSPTIIVGRSSNCELIFHSRYTSRLHAKFQYENGEFTVTDHSTNGTYIKNDEGEMFLMDEKMPLHGSGVVSLGAPMEYAEKDFIHYFCP